ncbi:MAG: aspartate--tRNA ligase [bacterium]|nr:aspartate--tRNA ligase [bacterium]
MRTLINETPEKIGEKVTLFGWVAVRRDHGKLIFIDLRDASGMLQVVFNPKDPELLKSADAIRSEWVVRIEGEIKKRPEGMINKDLPTGAVEMNATLLEVLSKAETPPFAVDTDGKEIGEDNRLMYRYLDLRRPRLQKNIRARAATHLLIRNFLADKGFIEIETPYLTRSTPEGARDYVVPSRLQKGSFYALPQSPQQYKQLLMVAGFEKYFQIVRCFRDEDTRGDRQPEFTQLDIEMSFVTEEDIINLAKEICGHIVKGLYPDKKITQPSFRRLTYAESMKEYGSDRPDLRKDKNNPNEFAFVIVTDFPMFEKLKDGSWSSVHHPFTLPKLEDGSDVYEALAGDRDLSDFLAHQYDVVLNGNEIAGGSLRIYKPDLLQAVFERLGHGAENFQEQFKHMVEAFGFGAPPHGGIAFGLDRLHTVLQNESSIREVIAFPKTGDGRDLMMRAPAELSDEQLGELGIEVKKKKKK